MEEAGSVTNMKKKNGALTGGLGFSVAERREGRECARLGWPPAAAVLGREGSWAGEGDWAQGLAGVFFFFLLFSKAFSQVNLNPFKRIRPQHIAQK